MAFIPVLVAALVAPWTREVSTFIGPLTVSVWPILAFLGTFGVFFHLLPTRFNYG